VAVLVSPGYPLAFEYVAAGFATGKGSVREKMETGATGGADGNLGLEKNLVAIHQITNSKKTATIRNMKKEAISSMSNNSISITAASEK
jgi:hypothetical protein